MTGGRLAGKVAVITGAARGMGEAHTRLFAREGARVVATDVLDDLGEVLADELRAAGHDVRFRHLDVSDEAAWKGLVADVEGELGAPTVLVNNAGIALGEDNLDDGDTAVWDRTLQVNQRGCYLGMRSVVPGMKRAGGGSIVNVASTLALAGHQDHFAYGATKGAVRMMTRSAALRYAPAAIRVNCVCPGLIKTPLNDFGRAIHSSFIAETPMLRAGEAHEVATVCLFLASDESSFVTGTDLVVDGGYLAR